VANSSQNAALVKLAEKYGLQEILAILNKATVEELRAINNWLKSLDHPPAPKTAESNPDFPSSSDLSSSEDESSGDEECSRRKQDSALSDSELDEEYVSRERECSTLWRRCSELYFDESLTVEE